MTSSSLKPKKSMFSAMDIIENGFSLRSKFDFFADLTYFIFGANCELSYSYIENNDTSTVKTEEDFLEYLNNVLNDDVPSTSNIRLLEVCCIILYRLSKLIF